jgi:hypothetical protein
VERLFTETFPTPSWGRIRKALQRAEGHFLRVALGIARSHSFVLATSPLKRWRDIVPSEALEFLAEALRQVRSTMGEPVTASEGWLPPVQQNRRYKRIGTIPASDELLEETLRAERARGKLRGKVLEPGSAAAWTFDASLSAEERDPIRGRMFDIKLRGLSTGCDGPRMAKNPEPETQRQSRRK